MYTIGSLKLVHIQFQVSRIRALVGESQTYTFLEEVYSISVCAHRILRSRAKATAGRRYAVRLLISSTVHTL